MKNWYVYIITNKNNTVLYIWVTSNLPKRIYEHKNKIFDWFSKEFNLYKLVYYEWHDSMEAAIIREKQLKKWKREWKDKLINEKNIYRNDLSEELQ